MNTNSPAHPTDRPGFLTRFFRRLFSVWMLKRALFFLVALITLVALFFAEENWRGRRALERYVREWEAKGERFDLESFIPPPVPDDQNMAMTPLLAGWSASEKVNETNRSSDSNAFSRPTLTLYRKDRPHGPTDAGGDWAHAKRVNLKAWQDYYRAPALAPGSSTGYSPRMALRYGLPIPDTPSENNTPLPEAEGEPEFPVAPEPQTPAKDVLLALSRFDAEIAELREAAERPFVRFSVQYDSRDLDGSRLRNQGKIKSIVQFLRVRTVALLADGQSDQALTDLRVCYRLMEGLEQEQFLISFLVRVACEAILLEPIWEGLADHRWTKDQLIYLQQRLGAADLAANFRHAIRVERAAFQITRFVGQPPPADAAPEDSFSTMLRLFAKMPRGWVYQNQIALYRLYQTVIDLAPGQSPDAVGELARQMGRHNPYTMMAVLLAPALEKTPGTAWRMQTDLNLAAVACALERYWLEHGAYPETLEQLEPQFIADVPLDFMSGRPLHYRRTDDGRFVLYSVGSDRKDNGGAFRPRSSTTPVPPDHDWVWTYPPSPAAGARPARE